ncbi:MAG: hypothetical protein ACRC78_18285 [Planktothrix sp.]
MNQKLVESLAEVILSLSENERILLYQKINVVNIQSNLSPSEITQLLDLEQRLQTYEKQYQMSSDNFYQRFRSGELGDSPDFFEWSVYYEMWQNAYNQTDKIIAHNS